MIEKNTLIEGTKAHKAWRFEIFGHVFAVVGMGYYTLGFLLDAREAKSFGNTTLTLTLSIVVLSYFLFTLIEKLCTVHRPNDR